MTGRNPPARQRLAAVDPLLLAESFARAVVVADPFILACHAQRPPFQHLVPLLAAARALASLGAVVGGEADFIAAAVELATALTASAHPSSADREPSPGGPS